MATTEIPAGEFSRWEPGSDRITIDDFGRDVVVDLTGYAPHDTVEMGNLVSAVRQFAAEGGNPVVVCPQPGTRILLETTGIDRLVPVVVDMKSAQAQFGENR